MQDEIILPGQRIELPQRKREALGKLLVDMLSSMEDEHSRIVSKAELWWRLYKGVPRSEVRNDPWPNASNAVVPLIRIHSDALSARKYNSMYPSKEVFIQDRTDEALGEDTAELVRFMNRASHWNEFDLHGPSLGAFREDTVLGTSIIQLGWGSQTQSVIDPRSLRPGATPKVIEVEYHNGPQLHHIPREQIMWQAGTPIQQSEIVVRQKVMTLAQISAQARAPNGWYPDSLEAIRQAPNLNLNVTRRHKAHMASHEMAHRENSQHFKRYDMREVWIELPVLTGFNFDEVWEPKLKPLTPKLVIHMHRDSGTITSIRPMPYALPHWPFFDYHFRGDGSRGLETGVAELLEHMQAIGTTLINQSVDAITLSNSFLGVTNDPQLLDKVLAPNRFIYTPDPTDSGVRLLQPSKLIQPDILLFSQVLGLAERVTGATDAAFGRDIRQGGHPSPATSTLTLLQEAKETLRTSLALARARTSNLAESIATLYQQFASEDSDLPRYQKWVGKEDGEAVMRMLQGDPITGRVGFDIKALTEENNPEAIRQRAAFIDQAVTNYFGQILVAADVVAKAAESGNTLQGQIAERLIRAKTESLKDILNSSSVDDIERFLLSKSQGGEQIEQLRNAIGEGASGLDIPVTAPTGAEGPLSDPGAALEIPGQ